jgi:hypothetical protein
MKIILKQVAYPVIAMLFLTGCRNKPVEELRQTIFFQLDYENNDRVHNGFIVEKDGKVLTYSNPEKWNYPDKNFILTENQIKEDLSVCRFSGITIPHEELNKYTGYIKNIASSKVTALKNVSRNEGKTEYICFTHSPDSAIYKGHIIKMEGDYTCENLNFFSKKVSFWLKSINDSLKTK